MESGAICKPSASEDPLESFGRIKMLTPSEMDFAFVKAAFRDRNDASSRGHMNVTIFGNLVSSQPNAGSTSCP